MSFGRVPCTLVMVVPSSEMQNEKLEIGLEWCD